MNFGNEETFAAGKTLIERYGSWSAVIAAAERRADGVVILPSRPVRKQAPAGVLPQLPPRRKDLRL